MQRSLFVLVSWLVAFGLLVSLAPDANGTGMSTGSISSTGDEPAPQARRGAGDVVPGRYVVVFREDNAGAGRRASALTRDLRIRVERRYSRVLDGFAAELTPEQVRQLRQDAGVASVEPVRVFKAHADLPTGVDRVGADATASSVQPTRAGSPVAVLDTGIAPHPAINVVGGHNCVPDGTSNFGDGYGHGTHVAGIIGARGETPGVAPGTPLFAVKVLDDGGLGSLDTVICGLEWLAANHARYNIKVANLSLGAPADTTNPESCATPSALLAAICALDKAGVTIVTSAGNDNIDARLTVPAKYDEVVTVGAMTDTDGCRGGKGTASSWGPQDRDDRRWSWSNHGPALDAVAPGVDILSTLPGGRYGLESGTSMAAPHVSAAIALGWDPSSGPRELGIPGFLPNQGLVRLSNNVGCPRAERITVSRRSVPVGGTLVVRVANFEPGERVRVTLDNRLLGVFVVKKNGAGHKRLSIPMKTKSGAHQVRATGSKGGKAWAKVRVQSGRN